MTPTYASTSDVKVPEDLLEQVIGQEEAVRIVRQSALSRRHLLLVGEPGTGKSMLGKALAHHLPSSQFEDIVAYSNPSEPTRPIIRLLPPGTAPAQAAREKMSLSISGRTLVLATAALTGFGVIWWTNSYYTTVHGPLVAAIYTTLAALIISILFGLVALKWKPDASSHCVVLLSRKAEDGAPFLDGTGAPVASLLGDVQHDPYQTGGLGTPPHERIQLGLIHRANGGVLFVDEIGTLPLSVQQELLTALQDGKFPIVGHNETSAGAGVRTEAVPCRFVLVAAGNMDSFKAMHPALRDRVRGNGYEVLMKKEMEDIPTNRLKLWQFVAQEVRRDGQIPNFSAEAMEELITHAARLTKKKGMLTLRLRQLGGLVRAAGDLAKLQGKNLVDASHVREAARMVHSIEEQQA